MEIYIIYSDPKQIENLDIRLDDTDTLIKYDENNFKQRKKAFKVKGSVAARLTPLVVVKENKVITKAFYREEFKDPISEFIKWKNNDTCEKLDFNKIIRNN